MTPNEKPKFAMYWASSCGGCDVAVLNIHEKILEVDANFEVVFWPVAMDAKYKDVEAMEDGSILLTLFNGAMRTDENVHIAKLLRRKSKILVAFGSCANEGCMPALANLSPTKEVFETSYHTLTTDNPAGILPMFSYQVPEGELTIPKFEPVVRTLEQVVPVDYYMPGCPPESHQIWNVVEAVIQGKPLPPRSSVLGAGNSTVCDECQKQKSSKSIAAFHRTWQIIPDPQQCLLEQGLVCMGVATRDGCGALCPQVNMPCSGCYGAPEGVADAGAKMLAALGSVLDLGGNQGLSEEQVAARADAILAGIPDPAGTFYQYTLGGSLLKRRVP